jgi:transcriptional regulator with XRE-family HTH domain
MIARKKTDYERFEEASAESRRLLRQEELILDVTSAICSVIEREGIKKAELAKRLDRTPGFVSQILAGGRNLTLRTIADVADALGSRVEISLPHVQSGIVGMTADLAFSGLRPEIERDFKWSVGVWKGAVVTHCQMILGQTSVTPNRSEEALERPAA